MSKKTDNFFEEHVEKMVLAISAVICMVIFVSRVLISPNYIIYENRKFQTGDIDVYISGQAVYLEDRLEVKPESKRQYTQRSDKFFSTVNSTLGRINTDLYWPKPNETDEADVIKPLYALPMMPSINDISVEHLRAVAYIPIEEITYEIPYGDAENEPNDIDLITVEGTIDIAALLDNFNRSFAGNDVKEQWQAPGLAKPVFAAVELCRQELLENGSWSQWSTVPRIKIDSQKEMFKPIEKVSDLPPGGMKVRLLRFAEPAVRAEILQPATYQIASAQEEWFPPSLHKLFNKRKQSEIAQEKREQLQAQREEREQKKEDARSKFTSRTEKTSRKASGSSDFEDMMKMMEGSMGGGASGKNLGGRSARTASNQLELMKNRKEKQESNRLDKRESEPETSSNIYDDFEKIQLTETSKLDKMTEPLIFWAHDDTIEPQKTYRYKMRLGVFNPVAGTNKLNENYKKFKEQVILWSDFSAISDSVNIASRLYFFPTEETLNSIKVQVSKYVLGYWYSEQFTVKSGELIGSIAGVEYEEEQENGYSTDDLTIPEMVDYSTGAMLVDILQRKDWAGSRNFRERYYSEVLYSFDGSEIEYLPVKVRFWPRDLQLKYAEIKKLEKEPKEPLRAFGSRRAEFRDGFQEDMPDAQQMDEMMMQMMMMQQKGN